MEYLKTYIWLEVMVNVGEYCIPYMEHLGTTDHNRLLITSLDILTIDCFCPTTLLLGSPRKLAKG